MFHIFKLSFKIRVETVEDSIVVDTKIQKTRMRPFFFVTIIGYRCKYLICRYLSNAISKTALNEKAMNTRFMSCVIIFRKQFESYVFHKSTLVKMRAIMPSVQSNALIRKMSCKEKLVVWPVFFKAYIKNLLPKMFSRAIQELTALSEIKMLCEKFLTEGINEVQL